MASAKNSCCCPPCKPCQPCQPCKPCQPCQPCKPCQPCCQPCQPCCQPCCMPCCLPCCLPCCPRPVTHVIFDLDGTLINSEAIYAQVYEKLITGMGKKLTPEIIYELKGATAQRCYQILIKTYQLPITPEEFHEKVMAEVFCALENVELMPGARKLVCHLSRCGVPIALATSSSADMVDLKTRKYHSSLFNLFNHKVMGGTDREVCNSKPAPDIFLIAARRFHDHPRPECCLVIEDAPNGVQAAVSAGMQVVMVPDPHTPKELTKSATLVLRSLNDFNPAMFGLPPYCN